MTTRFLASVTDVYEALLAVEGGADIVDCKDPARGALGALGHETVCDIRDAVPRGTLVSATIGDLPSNPDVIVTAVAAMAATGCDIVKVGFFPGGDLMATVAALGELDLGYASIVGVLLIDQIPDFEAVAFDAISAMAAAGFAGVMLDTGDKSAGRLTSHITQADLVRFIASAKLCGLFSGLAGSLRVSDIGQLMRLKPNVLGFRGALCDRRERTGAMLPEQVARVRAQISAYARDYNQ
jgi:(5-formylfuran-3-yl)methyl phosphate synthase